MRIALIGPTYPFRGGISHYTTLLFRHLKKRHDTLFISFRRQYPKILFPGRSDIDPSREKLREPGSLPIIDSVNPLTWLNAAFRIVKFKADVTIVPWWTSFWGPQFWTMAKIITHFGCSKISYLCHNVLGHESNLMDRIVTRSVLKYGGSFIVHSEEDRQTILNMFPGATVLKTHHPIYDIFNTENFDPESVRKTYGIEGHIILFFGFVRGYKGLKYLIDALPKVLSKINVTLLVVGEFWNNKRPYIRQIENYGLSEHITLIDEYVPNEDIGKYFNAADLVVQPYISATGSGVVQTAFGFNKPVIATTVGSLPEVIEDGKTGYLVSPGNSDELAKAILKFFTERKCREFSRNIQNQSNRFSWDKMVDLIESSIHSPCAYFEKTWSHNA